MKAKCKYFSLLVAAGFAALLYDPFPTLAATAPGLGQATSFGVLGASAVTNTGPTVITGDLGISPNNGSSVTGFPPGLVIGATHFADAVALGAQNDVTAAYNTLAGEACNTTISADLGGTTLVPGVYCSASSMGLTGTLTLDAQGDPNAVFIFQIGSTLTTASNSSVRVINGGQSCNVFWQIGSSATLGTDTVFVGNILALTSITLTTRTTVSGRALARTGAVTMDSNTVSVSVCGATTSTPTLGKAFSPATISAGGVSTLTVTLSNPNAATAALTAPLIDTLPSGVVIAATPNVSTTCGGGAPVAVAGGSTVTLPAGSSIPANGNCTLTANVTAAVGGSYVNTLAAGALETTNDNNAGPAVATLTVVPPVVTPPSAPIPTLSEWAMIMLAGLLVLVGVARIRRHAM
jgi:ice-binding like protein/exosortase sorting signal-containing protein